MWLHLCWVCNRFLPLGSRVADIPESWIRASIRNRDQPCRAYVRQEKNHILHHLAPVPRVFALDQVDQLCQAGRTGERSPDDCSNLIEAVYRCQVADPASYRDYKRLSANKAGYNRLGANVSVCE